MQHKLTMNSIFSPLKSGSRLRPHGSQRRKPISATLMLTSLVDAFTIILIYLLVSSADGEQMEVHDGLQLPQASFSQKLDESPVVVYKQGLFYIQNQPVEVKDLKPRLEALRKSNEGLLKTKDSAIIVQADESIGFDKLQPIMVASAYAGIHKVKFAVLKED